MLKLSSSERSELRSQAHALNPVVIIGEAGLTPAVIKEIEHNLDAHGLIKVRVFGDDREARLQIRDTICDELEAAPIQHIGKILVIYRPKKDKEKPVNEHRGKGLRDVVIVKKHETKRPTVKKVVLKGNERVTLGGLVKRVKPRQKSTKRAGNV